MFHQPKGAACPQGCGETMMFFSEQQAGACRYCQARTQQAIPGGTNAGQNFPTAPSMAPGWSSQPGAPQQAPASYPPNVQLVKQNSPQEMYEKTGDPRWLQAAEAQRQGRMPAPQQQAQPQTRPQAQLQASPPPTPIEVSAVVRDFYHVIGVLVECVEKLNVIANAFAQVPAPPPMNVMAHTAAGQVALTPELAAVYANMEQAQAPAQATVQAPAQALNPATSGKKISCLACTVVSLGAPLDESTLPHVCEKGAAHAKTTNGQSPSAPLS
jgi:hypothetical protein